MKFRPTWYSQLVKFLAKQEPGLTYGATPATVGIIPLYKANIPPSVLYIITMVAHMPGSFVFFSSVAKLADWMDNLVRVMSRGYVKNTDVIPADPPHTNLLREDTSPVGDSKNCIAISVTDSLESLHG